MVLITPQTGSVIEGPNGQDRTGTSLSTMIVIRVGNNPVGAIQNIRITEERTITMVDEVGTDGHIDSAPTRSSNFSFECRRVRYDRMRITEAFSRDFLHVHSQRIPFDIDIYDEWNGDGSNAIVTTMKNIWISNLNYDYQVDNWIVFDSMSGMAETMFSTLNGGLAATGGVRGSAILQDNPTEQQSDVGQRRGTMDVPGLISDYFTNV
jgi:hypothetical protein